MSVGPLTVEIICTFCISAYLLWKCGNWQKHHVLVTGGVLVSWYFSFIIVFILPLDISSTTYRQCLADHKISNHVDVLPTPLQSSSIINDTVVNVTSSLQLSVVNSTNNSSQASGIEFSLKDDNIPEIHCEVPWSQVPDDVLPNLWKVVYWTSQALTWLILPLMQSYSTAGDFTISGKIKTALIENAIYYGSYLFIVGLLLIYVAARPDLDLDGSKLKVICITASNTWGLFLLVLLLGYGLVEVPRTCWHNAKRGHMLQYIYFKASKLSTEKSEAEEVLEDVLDDIQRSADSIREGHALRPYVEVILSKCPTAWKESQRNRRRAYRDDERTMTETPTEKSLVRLHRQLIQALQTQHRTQTQWNTLVENGFHMEDVARNELNKERYFKRTFQESSRSLWKSFYTPTVEWYWNCMIRSYLLKALAVCLAFFTFLVLWSEVTFFNKSPKLSLFAIFLDLARKNYSYFNIELVSCLTISFMCVCAYYTIFKIRVLNYYYLAPGHQTDEYSLIFSGILLCRLTPPLCLNYLGLVHLDSHITTDHHIVETSYTKIMGHMDVISIVSDGFNIYFPMGIVLLSIATYFNLGNRCLHMIGFQQFIGDDDMTADLIDEGRELIKREKIRRQRLQDSVQRRKKFSDQLSGKRPVEAIQQQNNSEQQHAMIGMHRIDSDENSQAELLQGAEPMDYTEDMDRLYNDLESNIVGNKSTMSYQSVQDTGWGNRSRVTGNPPRGIFDDV